MHELSVTQSIIDICAKRADGARVTRVTLEIGTLAAIMPDAVRFCFELCAEGTALQGATLEIIEIAGRAQCRQCGAQLSLGHLYGCCDCGSSDLHVLAGQELKIRQMEVM